MGGLGGLLATSSIEGREERRTGCAGGLVGIVMSAIMLYCT